MSSPRDFNSTRKSSQSRGGAKRRLGFERLEERTVMNFDLSALPLSSSSATTLLNPHDMTSFGNAAYFIGRTPADGESLWKTDGTPASTKMVFDAETAFSTTYRSTLNSDRLVTDADYHSLFSGMRNLIRSGDRLYFTTESGIWSSDGTAAGTRRVFSQPNVAIDPQRITDVNGILFCIATLLQPNGAIEENHLLTYDTRTGTARDLGYTRFDTVYDVTTTEYFVDSGNDAYFFASRYNSQNFLDFGLWKSDGTLAGTKPVFTRTNGLQGTAPYQLTSIGNRVLFTNYDSEHGHELWTSDGTTAGTVMLKDIKPGADPSYVSLLRNVNGSLFFSADDGIHGSEPWKSDGTAAGTVMIKDLAPGEGSSGPRKAAVIGSTYYFVAGDGTTGAEVFRTDGTAAGTSLAVELVPGVSDALIGEFQAAGNHLLIGDMIIGRKWISDGTAANTTPLNQSSSGFQFEATAFGTSIVLGGSFYNYSTGAYSLLHVDSTTRISKSIPIPKNTEDVPLNVAQESFDAGGDLFFFKRLNSQERDLYRVDRFTGKIRYETRFTFPPSAGVREARALANGLVLFTMEGVPFIQTFDSKTGRQGVIETDIGSAPALREAIELEGNRLLFMSSGEKLWVSDGTTAGTTMLGAADPVLSAASIREMKQLGNRVVFSGVSADGSHRVWRTDGTAAGTELLLALPQSPTYFVMKYFPVLNGKAFFLADDGINGMELWVTDGTVANTKLLNDSNPGPGIIGGISLEYYPPRIAGNRLFYFGGYATSKLAMWVTDGTTAGTHEVNVDDVLDFDPVNSMLGAVNDKILFRTRDGRIYATDGTSANTTLLMDQGSFFAAYALRKDGNGRESLIFIGSEGDRNFEPWRTDGTKAGTLRIRDVHLGERNGIYVGPFDFQKVAFEDKISGVKGYEPLTIGGNTFFVANDGIHGDELWRTDGTYAGTKIAADLVPGSGSSHPRDFKVVGDSLFFTAYTREAGRQWYMMRFTSNAPRIVLSGTAEYRENAAPVILAPNAVVTTRDNKLSNNARLIVSISSGATANDRLSIVPQGNAVGQVNVTGKNVFFGGTIVGSFVGGTGSTPLTITLTSAATPQIMQAIARRIAFHTLGDAPSTTPRTIGFQGTDGAGSIGQITLKTVTVTPVNDAPLLQFSGTMRYTRGRVGALLAPNAIVSDIDSPAFGGGKLAVRYTKGAHVGNRIEFIGGPFTMQGNVLLAYDLAIGTIVKSGLGTNDLEIVFNTAAQTEIVQRLVRSLRFRTASTAPPGQRVLTATLSDGAGGVSNVSLKTIQVS